MSSAQLTTPHTTRARAGVRRVRAVPASADAPWAPVDRLVTAAVVAVGVALILVAWLGASDTTDWDTQLGWTALSMVGVIVVGVGVGIWLFRGFARVRTEAREVRRLLAVRIARRTIPTDDIGRAAVRVTVAGMAHHHSPVCLLVTGKALITADEAALAPCGVCG